MPAASKEKLLTVGKTVRTSAQRTISKKDSKVPLFATVASDHFIMPFINRMWLYLRDVSHQAFTAGSDSIILSSTTLSRFYSCLAVMLDAARHSPHFLAVIVPEAIELTLGMRGISLEEDVVAGQLQLILTGLQASVAVDDGRTLRLSFNDLIWKVKDFAGSIWEASSSQSEAGKSVRFAAAILLRVDEIFHA